MRPEFLSKLFQADKGIPVRQTNLCIAALLVLLDRSAITMAGKQSLPSLLSQSTLSYKERLAMRQADSNAYAMCVGFDVPTCCASHSVIFSIARSQDV